MWPVSVNESPPLLEIFVAVFKKRVLQRVEDVPQSSNSLACSQRRGIFRDGYNAWLKPFPVVYKSLLENEPFGLKQPVDVFNFSFGVFHVF